MQKIAAVIFLAALSLSSGSAASAADHKTAAADQKSTAIDSLKDRPAHGGSTHSGGTLQKFFRHTFADEEKSEPEEAGPKSTPENNSTSLSGSAQFTASLKTRDYELGTKALESRLYGEAVYRFNRALDNLKNNPKLYTRAKLGLAEAYLALDNFERARVLLNDLRNPSVKEFGPDSPEAGRYFAAISKLYMASEKPEAALSAAQESLRISGARKASDHDLSLALALNGSALYEQSYFGEAKTYYRKALNLLELSPGKDRLDYASTLEGLALAEKKLGNEKESAETMKKALAIKNDAVRLSSAPDRSGLVSFEWKEGLWGSRQIGDPVYPLKYMVVGDLRVAVTLVRSYKHLAVLISLANCSPHPMKLAAGPIVLEKIRPNREKLEFCDPGLIDEVLEEEVILSKTWRRRTLCHLQKSRRIPGYLKNNVLDPDDFFGNNEFGLYGAWESTLRDKPPIVTREQFFFDDAPKGADQEILGFMRGNGAIHPTFIEPGAAKTAIVFFLRERYEDALVRVSIGNAELKFPFHTAAGQ